MNEYDLKRFRDAQAAPPYGCGSYADALAEIRNGHKVSHWIWYIFPQLRGLGHSSMSRDYGIDGIGEARAYLADPVLRANLLEISGELLKLETCDPAAVMGSPDDKKLRSSMTLFAEAEPECEVFTQVLEKYFGGRKDGRTLGMLRQK